MHVVLYVLLLSLQFIHSYSNPKQKVPYNHEADVVVLSEEGSESQKAHLVDGGVNYTSSSPFDDVRNDNPVVGPTTSVAISKFIEEVGVLVNE